MYDKLLKIRNQLDIMLMESNTNGDFINHMAELSDLPTQFIDRIYDSIEGYQVGNKIHRVDGMTQFFNVIKRTFVKDLKPVRSPKPIFRRLFRYIGTMIRVYSKTESHLESKAEDKADKVQKTINKLLDH